MRTIINSDDLEKIIAIPNELKHQKVEVLILPLKSKTGKNNSSFHPEEFTGIFTISDVGKAINSIRDEWERS